MGSSCPPQILFRNISSIQVEPRYTCALGVVDSIGGTSRWWLVGNCRYPLAGGGEEPSYTSPHRSNIVSHLIERPEVRVLMNMAFIADRIKFARR